MSNSVDPDQTAPIGAVCSGSTLFASILNSSVMLANYLQQTTSADIIFLDAFLLGALRVNHGGESHDFKITTMADTIVKPVDSGKTFFDNSVNTGQICMGFEADTSEK